MRPSFNRARFVSGVRNAYRAGKLGSGVLGKYAKNSESTKSSKKGNAIVPNVDEASTRVVERAERLPAATQGLVTAFVSGIGTLTGQVAQFTAVLLLLFIVHQLFLWVDASPEKAFDRAALFLSGVEVVWDGAGTLLNAAVDVLNAGVIPIWNAGTYYIIEPGVILVFEVFSLVFLDRHYEGVVSEEQLPYAGFDCTATEESRAWCGRYSFYEQKLLQTDYSNQSLVFGVRTARRLSELSGEGLFLVPALDITFLTDALDECATLLIALAAPIADVAAYVFDIVFIESAKTLFDLFFRLLRSAFDVFKMIVTSGMFTTLLGVGLDFLVIW